VTASIDRTEGEGPRYGAYTERDYEAVDAAVKLGAKHFKPAASGVPGFSAVELDRDVRMHIPIVHNGRAATLNATAHAGIYFLDESDRPGGLKAQGHDWLYRMAFTSETDDAGGDSLQTVVDAEGVKFTIEADADVRINAAMEPLRVSERKTPIVLMEIAAQAGAEDMRADGDAAGAENVIASMYHLEKQGGITEDGVETTRKRPRKPAAANKTSILTSTKVERLMFGDAKAGDALTADAYDGQPIPIGQGKLKATAQLALTLDGPMVDNAKQAEKAVALLNDKQRYWLTQAHGVALDNPETRTIWGSDVLRKSGITGKALRPGQAATMQEAAQALLDLTHVSMCIDTTDENRAYHGKHVVRRITDRRVVNGELSLERYDDGSVDFRIDLLVPDGGTASSAFPLMEYAQDKNQYMPLDSGIFEFPGCGKVTVEQRRIMTAVYRHAAAKGLDNAENIDLEELWRKTEVSTEKSAVSKRLTRMEKLLDSWKSRGIVRSWAWAYRDKKRSNKRTGLIVKMP
jgi:hypothetical protein